MSKEKKIKIKCPNCGYEWKTRSKLRKVTCSSCGYKVPNPRYGKEQQILMEHFNLGEEGVKILDRKLNWVLMSISNVIKYGVDIANLTVVGM